MGQSNRSKNPPSPPKKTTLIIQLDEDLKKKFQELCKSKDLTCSSAIRQSIRRSVEMYEEEKKGRLFRR